MSNGKETAGLFAEQSLATALSRRNLLKGMLAAGMLSQMGALLPATEAAAGPAPTSDGILAGVIDMHIHPSPDVRQRRLSDIELAMEARRVGARAIVIKSHVVPTMDRAWIAEQVVPGIRVFGGITLNPEVGGLNPLAVDTAIKMGAKIVWLPTAWSANERRLMGKSDGVEVVYEGKVVPELAEILALVAKHKIILATGHLSFSEIMVVTEKAKTMGVEKILINHPEWWSVNLSLTEQKQLAPYGVYFERCYATRWPGKDYEKNFAKNVKAIETLGYQTTIISTDGGQMENPLWSTALTEYLTYLVKAGLPAEAIEDMTKHYPARLLDLD